MTAPNPGESSSHRPILVAEDAEEGSADFQTRSYSLAASHASVQQTHAVWKEGTVHPQLPPCWLNGILTVLKQGTWRQDADSDARLKRPDDRDERHLTVLQEGISHVADAEARLKRPDNWDEQHLTVLQKGISHIADAENLLIY